MIQLDGLSLELPALLKESLVIAFLHEQVGAPPWALNKCITQATGKEQLALAVDWSMYTFVVIMEFRAQCEPNF